MEFVFFLHHFFWVVNYIFVMIDWKKFELVTDCHKKTILYNYLDFVIREVLWDVITAESHEFFFIEKFKPSLKTSFCVHK